MRAHLRRRADCLFAGPGHAGSKSFDESDGERADRVADIHRGTYLRQQRAAVAVNIWQMVIRMPWVFEEAS
jgi:hypothetical protein